MNLLKNNGWKCLWRGHPAQPTDQLKPQGAFGPLLLWGGVASKSEGTAHPCFPEVTTRAKAEKGIWG